MSKIAGNFVVGSNNPLGDNEDPPTTTALTAEEKASATSQAATGLQASLVPKDEAFPSDGIAVSKLKSQALASLRAVADNFQPRTHLVTRNHVPVAVTEDLYAATRDKELGMIKANVFDLSEHVNGNKDKGPLSQALEGVKAVFAAYPAAIPRGQWASFSAQLSDALGKLN